MSRRPSRGQAVLYCLLCLVFLYIEAKFYRKTVPASQTCNICFPKNRAGFRIKECKNVRILFECIDIGMEDKNHKVKNLPVKLNHVTSLKINTSNFDINRSRLAAGWPKQKVSRSSEKVKSRVTGNSVEGRETSGSLDSPASSDVIRGIGKIHRLQRMGQIWRGES